MAKKKSTAGKKKSSSSSRKRTAKKLAVEGKPEKETATKKKSAAEKTPGLSSRSPVSPKRVFPVVGLGASAGGLEALEEFLKKMSADSGMAFVVVMHQAAKHVSLMPELLSKCTKMAVASIKDRMTIEQNLVYIVPPGKNLDLLRGAFHLSDLPAKHAAPLPIDHFFRSLAAERREMAVAIVLSGTGTDGTMGLSAIKGEAGMVMVQSVQSAKFSGMPQNAIDAGWADYVLAPGEMPAKLIAYSRGPILTSQSAIVFKRAI